MNCGVRFWGPPDDERGGVDRHRATPRADAAATVPVMVAVETTSLARPDWHTTQRPRRRESTVTPLPTADRSVGEEGRDLTSEVVEVLEEERVSRVAVQHELGVGQLLHCGVGRVGVDHDVV